MEPLKDSTEKSLFSGEKEGYVVCARSAHTTYRNPLIACFARHFGRPSFTLKIDTNSGVVEDVIVERSSPCGSTHFAAAKLEGMPTTGIVPQAGLIALHYPCLASMHPQRIGNQVETLMHVSGCIVNEALEEELYRHTSPSSGDIRA